MVGPDGGFAQWFVLWTHSHCEQLVHDQLAGKFDVFLPTIRTWSRRKGKRRVMSVPMFPGYLFLRHAIDKTSYISILGARGIVRILGDRWDLLAPVPDDEVAAIRRIVESDLPMMPFPYLREGQRVRIVDGPLTGVEGILVHAKPTKGLLVLSVNLLQRSVAVELDCSQVVPAESGRAGAAPFFAPQHQAPALQRAMTR